MYDNVAVIEENPAGVGASLVVMRQDAPFFKFLFNIVADGAHLPDALGGADNKIVRKTALFTDIKQDDIAGLLIAGDFNGFTG
jgi:hypothetical protein